jgi:hypothetical protein
MTIVRDTFDANYVRVKARDQGPPDRLSLCIQRGHKQLTAWCPGRFARACAGGSRRATASRASSATTAFGPSRSSAAC